MALAASAVRDYWRTSLLLSRLGGAVVPWEALHWFMAAMRMLHREAFLIAGACMKGSGGGGGVGHLQHLRQQQPPLPSPLSLALCLNHSYPPHTHTHPNAYTSTHTHTYHRPPPPHSSGPKPLDADTMFPILVWCLCHAHCPRLHRTLAFLRHFALEAKAEAGEDTGEADYYLTCTEAAFSHVLAMKVRRREPLPWLKPLSRPRPVKRWSTLQEKEEG